MPSRGISDIDRELSALAAVYTDIRSSGRQAATYAIDGLLDERLTVCSFSDEAQTEEIAAIRLSGTTSR